VIDTAHVHVAPVLSAAEQQGRISGDVSWRQSRGELGNTAPSSTSAAVESKGAAPVQSCTVPPATVAAQQSTPAPVTVSAPQAVVLSEEEQKQARKAAAQKAAKEFFHQYA